MGYIYLKPPVESGYEENFRNKNEIAKYVNLDEITIPYVTNAKLTSYLDQMTIAVHTFKEDYKVVYDTEYGNDMDDYGYVTGIELKLHHEKFIDLIKNQAFKVFQVKWKDKEFHLVTLDREEIVFNPAHVIYKLSDKEDAFVIVKLEEPEKLGHHYPDPAERRPIALIKGLISARNDIYPLEYMTQPEFHLQKDSSFQFIDNDLVCEVDALQSWNSITLEQRDQIINNVYCGNCSNVVKVIDCTIHNDPYGVLLRGKCNNCRNRIARFVERN